MPLDSLTYGADSLAVPQPARGLGPWTGPQLAEAREALCRVLDHTPDNAPHLLAALYDGRVHGSYIQNGDVRCIVGWGVFFASGRPFEENVRLCGQLQTGAIEYLAMPATSDGLRASQRACAGSLPSCFGQGIVKGDTPATNPISALVARWTAAWIAEHERRRLGAECSA